jgi:hypothetical protein
MRRFPARSTLKNAAVLIRDSGAGVQKANALMSGLDWTRIRHY